MQFAFIIKQGVPYFYGLLFVLSNYTQSSNLSKNFSSNFSKNSEFLILDPILQANHLFDAPQKKIISARFSRETTFRRFSQSKTHLRAYLHRKKHLFDANFLETLCRSVSLHRNRCLGFLPIGKLKPIIPQREHSII